MANLDNEYIYSMLQSSLLNARIEEEQETQLNTQLYRQIETMNQKIVESKKRLLSIELQNNNQCLKQSIQSSSSGKIHQMNKTSSSSMKMHQSNESTLSSTKQYLTNTTRSHPNHHQQQQQHQQSSLANLSHQSSKIFPSIGQFNVDHLQQQHHQQHGHHQQQQHQHQIHNISQHQQQSTKSPNDLKRKLFRSSVIFFFF